MSMVSGMATKKVTITLDEEQLHQIRQMVETGKAATVSGFIAHAVSVALDDVTGWGAVLGQALEATGGPLTNDEREWAREVLGSEKQNTTKRRRVA